MTLAPASAFVLLLVGSFGQLEHEPHDRPPTDGPMVYIAERSVDLGRVREGDTAVATFLIENRGTQDLVIESASTSCGCTVAELAEEDKRIKPNASLPLIVSFNSKGKLGRQRNSVVLTLNDPHEPRINLVLWAQVETLFHVEPQPLVHLRSAHRGATLEPLDVYPAAEGAVLENLEVGVPPELLEYERTPIENDAGVKGERLIFRVPAEIELGIVEGKMTLRGVVDGEAAELLVRVTGLVVGDLVVRPAALQSLSPTPRGRSFAPVTVASTIDTPFRILSVDAGPYLDVQFEDRSAGKEWTIRSTLREDAPDGPLATTVIIRTDNAAQPVLRAPVFVDVRPQYLLEPELVMLGGAAGKESRRIRIQRGDSQELRIRGIKGAHPAIAGQVEENLSHQREVAFVRIGVVRGAAPTEPMDTEVVIQTNLTAAPELRIPVHYNPAAISAE